MLLDLEHPNLSISHQASLLGLSRSSIYYHPVVDDYNLLLMNLIDEQYMRTPFYGSRRMTVVLRKMGHEINRKRVSRLMHQMGIEAIYPKPRTTLYGKDHKKYPYLLRNLDVTDPNQVWCADITYIRMQHGFLYLIAVMDWFSRYILSWELSVTMDVGFCVKALESALRQNICGIFNTDQGSQFTSEDFTGKLLQNKIKISMDGRGRALDNVFIERVWRSLKYEEVYLKNYADGNEAYNGIKTYFEFYNNERPHQGLEYKTPASLYYKGKS